MADLPSGTVTFLFTDVEGSTRLLREHGDGYAALLAEQRRAIRAAVGAHGGVEMGTEGDAVFAVFARAADAVAAAGEAQAALGAGPVRVRMGLHTGAPLLTEEGYVGIDVHRAARISAAGHGGQVLLSHATRDLVEADVRDLGEHRLKDLAAPERVFQLGDGDFPPLRSLGRTNLPVPTTAFLGRARELGEVRERLTAGEVRLLTLTGPGGTGKTRLAVQAAAEVSHRYPDGVWWVGLAPVREPPLVLEAVARTLGARRALAEHVGARRMLLVLDNFEQVLDAAPDVAGLLTACPGLDVLVTSRAPLRVEGEWEYRVDPLTDDEAVALFTQRARAVERDVELDGEVAEICRRLDCLPLALELAAARVKVLAPPALLDRLRRNVPVLATAGRDAPERQRTLRATIEWSHDLLSRDAQRLFARLSVFAGGCTLEAAEAVSGADLDTLASLVDESLVRRRGERYWMLETIREFAAERLEASGDGPAVRAAHARWYADLAQQARPEWRASGAARWRERLEEEDANLRAAVAWALGPGDRAVGHRLVAGAWGYWFVRGSWREGRRLAEAALDGGSVTDPEVALELLWGAAMFALWQGDTRASEARAREIAAFGEAHAMSRAIAISQHVLAIIASLRGDCATAVALNDEAAATARTTGDHWLLGIAVINGGDALMKAGDFEAARSRFAEGLELGRKWEDPIQVGLALGNLGLVTFALGEVAEARDFFVESLDAAVMSGSLDTATVGILGIGLVACERDPARGAALVSASEALVAHEGGGLQEFETTLHEKALARARSELGDAAFERAVAEGRALSLDDAVALARRSA
jgi:predicted ATPase/class 3 adenylate cyclase